MRCKICGADATQAFTEIVLRKYNVSYFRCVSCGFIQTEDPHWLAEAYTSAITEIDIGPVNRAISASALVEGMILGNFNRDAKYLDYGAGYGLLVRLMRDRGFDFYWYDRYCANLFAKHFEVQPGLQFELVTAFEIFEHLSDPLSEIGKMLDFSSNVLFSTLLVPRQKHIAADWWYFAPEQGQHISFYTVPALQSVAKHFGLHLSTDGVGLHLFSRKPIPDRTFRFFARDTRWSKLARRVLRRRMRKQSLLSDDFQAISGHTLPGAGEASDHPQTDECGGREGHQRRVRSFMRPS